MKNEERLIALAEKRGLTIDDFLNEVIETYESRDRWELVAQQTKEERYPCMC